MIDIDETTRRKLRSLRLSRFAENFFDLVTSDEHADALPEEIFLRAVDATDACYGEVFGNARGSIG